MRFGEMAVDDALGAVLAHSVKTDDGRIAKGTRLDKGHLRSLVETGLESIFVAVPDEGDIAENEAAGRIAETIRGEGLRIGSVSSGRANLFAEANGLFRADVDRVDGLNGVSPDITLATLSDREHVTVGRLVATVKVIPFSTGESVVARCERIGEAVKVNPYVPSTAALVQTRLSSVKESVLDKTRRITEARLLQCGASLGMELRCEHRTKDLAAAIGKMLEGGPNLLLICGASAVCDENDIVPAAITACDGEVRRVGMPVDPGNLLVLARIGKTAVLGLPGCARSPKMNGLDWVLRRLCVGECVTSDDILHMGVGGLLEEIHERPQPRVLAAGSGQGPFAAVLLAAGLSSRMGVRNKLLEKWRDKPLLQHAAETVATARDNGTVASAVLVTGKDHDEIVRTVDGWRFKVVHNDSFESGMASSLACGIGVVPQGYEGAFVLLGDMPLVEPDLLSAMAAAFSPTEGKDIVVPVCGGKRGHPVLFGARHFPDLMALDGDTGAKWLLARNEEATVEVQANRGSLADLDDPEAFGRE